MDDSFPPPVRPIPVAGDAPNARRFLDREGRLRIYPSKRKDRLLVLAWLASHFDLGAEYTEKEVNARLNELHTFGDWALLRRELFDERFLDRDPDGTRYRRRRAA